MNLFSKFKLVGILLMLCGGNVFAADLLVPSQYSTIQAAINAANTGDRVLVAPGTYIENINFNGKGIVVTSSQGPNITVIDGNQAGPVVTFDSDEDNSSSISGFTIRNGRASPENTGGGVVIERASPIVENNIITENIFGGRALAVYIDSGAAIFRNNRVIDNIGFISSGNFGGAITVFGSSGAEITNNIIVGNSISNAGVLSGAISLVTLSSLKVEGNYIADNTSNIAGGGIAAWGSDYQIINNIIVRNNAIFKGGGIYVRGFTNPSGNQPLISNNTLIDNTAMMGSQIHIEPGNSNDIEPAILNNILFHTDNVVSVYCEDPNNYWSLLLFNNNVFSNSGSLYGGNCTDQTGLNGNISTDPLFANTLNDDFHLTASSASIDSGDNTNPNLPVTDFDGSARVLDGNSDTIVTIDQGAYEFNPNGLLKFGSSGFNVNENSSTITIDVCRIGGTTGDVSATFSTSDGTAIEGVHYVISTGSIMFSDGESGCKTFAVTIIDNQLLSQDVTFNVGLDNPIGGATISTQSNVEVKIIDNEVDLSLSKDTSQTDVSVGEDITYDMIVSNNQTSNAQDVVVTDILSSSLDFVSATPSQGSCSGTTTITCNLGNIVAGDSATITLVVTGNIAGSIDNTANVSVNGNDIDASNNSDSATVTVNALPAAVELFPLIPGTTFNYLVNSSFQETETVLPQSAFNGVQAFGVRDNEGDIEYYTNDVNGLLDYGSFDTVDGQISTVSPPVKFLEAQPLIGEVINQTGTFTLFDPINGSFPLDYTFSSTVQGLETITVPLGTYEALKVDLFIEVSGFINGVFVTSTQTSSSWLALGIGEIRAVTTLDGVTDTRELISIVKPPQITSPTAGSTLSGSSMQIDWNANGTSPQQWAVTAGPSANTYTFGNSGAVPGNASSATFNSFPTNGQPVFIQLWNQVNGIWSVVDEIQVTAFNAPSMDPQITSPTAGSTLSGSSMQIDWNANGTSPQQWAVTAGPSANTYTFGNSGAVPGNASSATFNSFPTNGQPVFIQLWNQVNGIWSVVDEIQVTAFNAPSMDPQITSPTAGSTLSGSSMQIDWNANGTSPQQWAVTAGPSANTYTFGNSGAVPGNASSATFNSFPTNGQPVFIQLWNQVNGIWSVVDEIQVTAFNAPSMDPQITSPTAGSTLSGSSMQIDWNANGTSPQQWAVTAGPSANTYTFGNSGAVPGNASSATFNSFPTNGQPVFIQLWNQVNGIWSVVDEIQVTAFNAPSMDPQITSPTAGSTLSGSSMQIDWNANGTSPQQWAVTAGPSANTYTFGNSGAVPGNASSATFNSFPTNGQPVFIQLWNQVNGIWSVVDEIQVTADTLFIGQFNVSGLQTDTGCQDPADNGTSSYTGIFNVASQSGNSFVGTLNILTIDGVPLFGTGVTASGPFTATVNQNVNAVGDYTLNGQLNGVLIAQNQGTFSGSLSIDTLSINYVGMDTVGDTCSSSGSFSGSR